MTDPLKKTFTILAWGCGGVVSGMGMGKDGARMSDEDFNKLTERLMNHDEYVRTLHLQPISRKLARKMRRNGIEGWVKGKP